MEPSKQSPKTLGQECIKHLPQDVIEFMRKEWTREPTTIWAAGPTGIMHAISPQSSIHAKSYAYAAHWLVKQAIPKGLQQALGERASGQIDIATGRFADGTDLPPQRFTVRHRIDRNNREFSDTDICCSSLQQLTKELLEYLNVHKREFLALEVTWQAPRDPAHPNILWPNLVTVWLQLYKIEVQLLDEFEPSVETK